MTEKINHSHAQQKMLSEVAKINSTTLDGLPMTSHELFLLLSNYRQ